jgi:hypothetical protein
MDETELTGGPRAGSPRQPLYLLIAAGCLHAILFLVAYWLLSAGPGGKASAPQIVAFYHSASSRRTLLGGLYVMPFAGIAFIWFLVALRAWIAGRSAGGVPALPDGALPTALLWNVQLLSGAVYVTLFLATAVAFSATATAVGLEGAPVSAGAARLFLGFGHALMFIAALRMAAMFVFATSTIGRRARVLARWFAYVSDAVGIVLLVSFSLSPVLIVIFPAWLVALCASLLRRT